MTDRLQARDPLHPCVSVLSAVAFFIGGLLLARGERLPAALALLFLLYLLFGLGRAAGRCLALLVPTGLLIGLVTLLVRRDGAAAVQMWGRVVLAGLAAVPVLTMPHIDLVRWLTQRRCPRVVTLGMLIAVRFLPVLGSEIAQIKEAMKTRGVRATLWNASCFYRALVMPLMLRVVDMSDTMALSLETRAFDLDVADVTVYRPVRFSLRDGLYCACAGALLIGSGVLL